MDGFGWAGFDVVELLGLIKSDRFEASQGVVCVLPFFGCHSSYFKEEIRGNFCLRQDIFCTLRRKYRRDLTLGL